MHHVYPRAGGVRMSIFVYMLMAGAPAPWRAGVERQTRRGVRRRLCAYRRVVHGLGAAHRLALGQADVGKPGGYETAPGAPLQADPAVSLYRRHGATGRNIDDPARAERARGGHPRARRRGEHSPSFIFSVEWWNTLHQPASLAKVGLPIHPCKHPRPAADHGRGRSKAYFFTVVLVRMRYTILERENIRSGLPRPRSAAMNWAGFFAMGGYAFLRLGFLSSLAAVILTLNVLIPLRRNKRAPGAARDFYRLREREIAETKTQTAGGHRQRRHQGSRPHRCSC